MTNYHGGATAEASAASPFARRTRAAAKEKDGNEWRRARGRRTKSEDVSQLMKKEDEDMVEDALRQIRSRQPSSSAASDASNRMMSCEEIDQLLSDLRRSRSQSACGAGRRRPPPPKEPPPRLPDNQDHLPFGTNTGGNSNNKGKNGKKRRRRRRKKASTSWGDDNADSRTVRDPVDEALSSPINKAEGWRRNPLYHSPERPAYHESHSKKDSPVADRDENMPSSPSSSSEAFELAEKLRQKLRSVGEELDRVSADALRRCSQSSTTATGDNAEDYSGAVLLKLSVAEAPDGGVRDGKRAVFKTVRTVPSPCGMALSEDADSW